MFIQADFTNEASGRHQRPLRSMLALRERVKGPSEVYFRRPILTP